MKIKYNGGRDGGCFRCPQGIMRFRFCTGLNLPILSSGKCFGVAERDDNKDSTNFRATFYLQRQTNASFNHFFCLCLHLSCAFLAICSILSVSYYALVEPHQICKQTDFTSTFYFVKNRGLFQIFKITFGCYVTAKPNFSQGLSLQSGTGGKSRELGYNNTSSSCVFYQTWHVSQLYLFCKVFLFMPEAIL